METTKFLAAINANLPSGEELILFYSKFGDIISKTDAYSEIEGRTLVYNKILESSNLIEDLIYNTNISNIDIAFFRFLNKIESQNLQKFAEFLECDPIYLSQDTKEIWVQKPGYYYYDFPDKIIKGFSTPVSFLESLLLMSKALADKMYRNIPLTYYQYEKLIELNDIDCIEFLEFFYKNIRDFE